MLMPIPARQKPMILHRARLMGKEGLKIRTRIKGIR
jgi:hypothetical protein